VTAAVRVCVMPSHLHEVLVEMFRDRPKLAAEILAGPLGVAVPEFEQARLSSGALTDVAPTEYRADVVVTLVAADAPVLAIIIEAQLRVDVRKRRTWPAYVATLHARLGCPVNLLVVCADPGVAAWCAAPIVVSDPGLALTPLVLGPDRVPVVTEPALATRSPELAVLSAMAHGARSDPTRIFEAMLAGLNVVDHDHANLYADVVLAVLPAAARDCLEALMTTAPFRYQSDFARRYFDQGRTEGEAKGEAKAVLAVLDARDIEVPADVREDIAGCADLEQLDIWVRRAVTANKVHDLFD
jgi:hypothetical protein